RPSWPRIAACWTCWPAAPTCASGTRRPASPSWSSPAARASRLLLGGLAAYAEPGGRHRAQTRESNRLAARLAGAERAGREPTKRVVDLVQLVLVLPAQAGGEPGIPDGGGPIDRIAGLRRLEGRDLLLARRDGTEQPPPGFQQTPPELGGQHAVEGPRRRAHDRSGAMAPMRSLRDTMPTTRESASITGRLRSFASVRYWTAERSVSVGRSARMPWAMKRETGACQTVGSSTASHAARRRSPFVIMPTSRPSTVTTGKPL